MKFMDVLQGSPEWHAARKGIPTASCFDRILTPKTRQYSRGTSEYIAELIGEKFSIYQPERAESYTSNPMRHGVETEEEARRFLSMECRVQLSNGGFCLTDCGRFGASPDALIGEDGVSEIKCPTAKVQAKYLLNGGLPEEYACQIYGELFVTRREYCLFLSYHPGLPPHLVRVTPDAGFMDDLAVRLEMFWRDYQEALAKIKAI